jgi:S-DNA-T family DNA segregation ATPase FtsK/SpoIIIE
MTLGVWVQPFAVVVRRAHELRPSSAREAAMLAHRAARLAGDEALWWATRLAGAVWFLARRARGPLLVLVALVWLLAPVAPSPPTMWLAATGISVLVLRAWARVRPVSFSRCCVAPVCGVGWWLWLRWRWRPAVHACGLSVWKHAHPDTVTVTAGPARRRDLRYPRLEQVRVSWPRIRVVAVPVLGQTVGDFEKTAEALRAGLGATQLRVEPHRVNRVGLTFTVGDPLADPFTAALQDRVPDELDAVPLGRAEDGSTWRLPVGPHTLVAGCSGSGKASLFWGFAFGLAPAAAQGRVRLHGIDLKGGMEVLMGADLFTTTATTPAEAVTLLEQLVGLMQDRTRRYAGLVRCHTTTVAEPLHVVMIDELAALTAYCPERDLQRRGELAIHLLCSQGRAPGFMVFACLQDPRKEVIPARGLFTQMVGLRLKDVTETAMVLGDQAVTTGAHCHRISRHTPGVGYVLPEHGGAPVRVRAGHASDPMIRQAASRFPAPQWPETALVPTAAVPASLPRHRTRPAATWSTHDDGSRPDGGAR